MSDDSPTRYIATTIEWCIYVAVVGLCVAWLVILWQQGCLFVPFGHKRLQCLLW